MQGRPSSRELLLEFDRNPLCQDIENENLKGILRLLLNRWSKPSWNNPLWQSKYCKFMLNHGLEHIKNVFLYATRLYYVIQSKKKDFVKNDADKFRLIVSIWLHDWGLAGPLGYSGFSEVSGFLREEGGYKPEVQEAEIDDMWVRKNHSLLSCFNILNGYEIIDEKLLMDSSKELKKFRDDIADLCCYHSMSTPLTLKQKESRKYEIQIRSLEDRNSSLLTLCALLRILDSCDETWYRVAEDYWEYEKWLNDHSAHRIIGEIENVLHEQKKGDLANKLLKVLDSGKIKKALEICESISPENSILAENLKRKVEGYERYLGMFLEHTKSKADIWDVFFNFENDGIVEIIVFPFGFRYCLTEDKRKFLEKTVIKRIREELRDSEDYLKRLGLSFTVRLAKPEDDPKKLEVPGILPRASDRLIKELKGEILRDSLFLPPASQEEIFDFYCGAPISWKMIAADGDIRRDQEIEIIEQALQGNSNFQIVCIVAEPGAGKTTVAWRASHELFRQGELVVHFYNDNPDVWYKLSQLAEGIDRPFYVLIDDIFRNREFVKALQNITKDNLPVTVLATSRSAEYHKGRRLERHRKKIELKLSVEEKNALLKRLGKSYDELFPEVQHAFSETDLFLVLGMVLTKGKGFDEIISDIIEKLITGDEEYHDALSRAYEYVCFSYSYGISIPEELLSKLDREGRFYTILEKERGKGVFYEDTRPQHPTRFIRAGAELIAVKALELYRRVFSGKSPEALFRGILEATNEDDSIHRRYITYLTRALLHQGKNTKSIEDIIAKSERISRVLRYATISELDIWKSIFKELKLQQRGEKCAEEILSHVPRTTQDCQILVNEFLKRKLESKAFSAMRTWLTENPEDKAVLERYLVLVREKGIPEQLLEAIDSTFAWLKAHPADNKVRSVFLTLVRDRGFLKIEYVKESLEDAEKYLRKHGPHHLFPIYLTLVKKVKKAGIGVEIDTGFVSEMGYRFIDSCRWEDNIKQIDDFARWLSQVGLHKEAEEIYKKLIPASQIRGQKIRADVHFGYGMLYMSQCFTLELGKLERAKRLRIAEEKFRKALENLKGHMARAYLGIVLWEQRLFEEAEKEFKHVEWWSRNVPTVGYRPGKLFFEIGKFYSEFNRHKAAKFWYKKATKEEPKKFANWWGLGKSNLGLALVLEREGRRSEAKDLFSEALLELEKALEKAPKPLQLPASKDIPARIEECKKHLESLEK